MPVHDRDPILLTPGPLTTSLATRCAMLRDHGSWDAGFNAITARVRAALLAVVNGAGSHVCVPMQGSGTFAVEAVLGTLVPPAGHLLVLVNGAYGTRMARAARLMGLAVSVLECAEDRAVDVAALAARLAAEPQITHVGAIHCETSTGILNPLDEIAAVVERAGRALFVDAMSSFGALPIDARRIRFDALVAASGKCVEGPPGMGFAIVRGDVLAASEGRSRSLSLDLHDQWQYMERTGQWRFTPPTHVVAALDAALDQYAAQGGQAARLARYRANCDALLVAMAALGLTPLLDAAIQAPIIVTFHAPRDPAYTFARLYEAVRARGFILYPGKLTRIETFRVGCIGAIGEAEIVQAVHAVGDALAQMGVQDRRPAQT
ncbi:2-aminoethylphosphonate--pyruvate transaminase [Pseudothauera lacus]|uniref:2-aminoethylphosphonate--pyruvate transaminase n=1 Tax=Pseudothauera lacus TaxID=2136175 RepID=A0A2T4IGM7_9RHOO|nr:2-aminoethylphosphonate--pyruvate transaminase [Pseudothauera lacus]PTD96917.1 2-aminoethylphosphonate--pyruvate transaminase [Pseudothauera lacus]